MQQIIWKAICITWPFLGTLNLGTTHSTSCAKIKNQEIFNKVWRIVIKNTLALIVSKPSYNKGCVNGFTIVSRLKLHK